LIDLKRAPLGRFDGTVGRAAAWQGWMRRSYAKTDELMEEVGGETGKGRVSESETTKNQFERGYLLWTC
jgi:hypothetical protein